MEIKMKFYGTRGSIPVCEPEFQEFGGNTTCIGLFHHDRIALLDAGTGIRRAGREIMERDIFQEDITVNFTHFHWDHIQGLPFFTPAYAPDRVINLLALGKGSKIQNLKQVLTDQMGGEYFPIELHKMGARFNFMMLEQEDLHFRQINASTIKLNHPGGCYGFRIETEGKVVVICTDHEHENGIDRAVVDFARDADLLIHDAQYTDEQLAQYKGWGHSSYSQAIDVAEQAGVKMLAMTHHDPNHDDEFLKKQEKICQDRFKDCVLARDGMEIPV